MARPTSVNEALHQLDDADLDTTLGMRQAADALAFLDEIERTRGLAPEVREIYEEARAEVAARANAMTGIGEPQTAETLAEATAARSARRSFRGDAAASARLEGQAERFGVGLGDTGDGGMPDAIGSQVFDTLSPEEREAWQREFDRMVEAGMDPDDAREAVDAMAMFGQLGSGEDDPFVGVPEGHTADPTDEDLQRWARGQFAGIGPSEPQRRQPRYRVSDIDGLFSMSQQQITALQRKMVAAGLLTGEFRYGWASDQATQQAYAALLGMANERGLHHIAALDRLEHEHAEQRETARQEAMDAFVPDPFLAPDPDALRNRARSTLLAMGRRHADIDDAELDRMTDVMSGNFKRQHQMQAELARRMHGAEVEAEFGGTPGEIDMDGIEDIDPLARFDEWFASSDGFGGEIETRETSAEVARRGATFEQGLARMRGAVRGG